MPDKVKDLSRRKFLGVGAAVGAAAAVGGVPALAMAHRPASPIRSRKKRLQIFVNNVGYETHGPKRLVLGTDSGSGSFPFRIFDTTSGALMHQGTVEFVGPVEDWAQHSSPSVPSVYWTGDFSSLARRGQYVVVVDGHAGAPASVSCPFLIETDIYARKTMSPVLHYFKGSRSSGQFAKWDSHLPVGKNGKEHVDVHGGWYDATGDVGIHFGQAFPHSPATFVATTQTPLLAWVLFASYAQIKRRKNEQLTQIGNWLRDEAMYGADFLVRMHPKNGSFYSSIVQPELDHPNPEYEPYNLRYLEARNGVPELASFRLGGGSAIAALAVASTCKVSGEYDSRKYLATAVQAFQFLHKDNNNKKLNRGTPDNILDDSEILLAATELYKATHDHPYAVIAHARAHNLAGRLGSWHQYHNYWRGGSTDEPFFNASNEGLPTAYLVNYLSIAEPRERIQLVRVLRKAIEFDLEITRQVTNPFGYAREFVQDAKGHRYTNFFYPHDVTPSTQPGGWWQGENARIASLATAARLVAQQSGVGSDNTSGFTSELERYATDQLNWICGLNPYASSMLDGVGLNNPTYYDANGTWRFLHQAGGIVNGISGLTAAGKGIEYEPDYRYGGYREAPQVWRHMEQWLPHSTWFLYATAIGPTG